VVPTGRRCNLVEAVAEQIRSIGKRSLAVTSDVTSMESLRCLLDSVTAEFSSVDILVNCAGRTARKPTLDLPESEWSEILDTNLTGTLRACQMFGRQTVERRYGRIMNIGPLSSFVAVYEVYAYAASKSAVASLTKSLAIEWAATAFASMRLCRAYSARN
jgi:NAD(P)-dependent dehydrogenase (short-subunit alcohol dehydrogenase family)